MPALTDDLDTDALISRLSGPLQPSVRAAFRAAAEDALTRLPCLGPGVAYRTLALLQRSYFDPPAHPGWVLSPRPSKLRDAAPIDELPDRYRKQER